MRWFTSDHHFGHFNMTKAEGSKDLCDRPWASVEEMNEALIELWNELVDPLDVVIVGGDAAMGKRDETLPLYKRLNGAKHLISGNHDKCWTPGCKTYDKYYKMRDMYMDLGGFSSIHDEADVVLADGTYALLSHFPYEGDSHDEDRYSEYRPEDQGSWLIHGHVHEKWRQNGRMINVGVDAWNFRPVSEDTIIDMIHEGPQYLDRLETDV